MKDQKLSDITVKQLRDFCICVVVAIVVLLGVICGVKSVLDSDNTHAETERILAEGRAMGLH
jgi:hypothetical protein